MGEPEAIRAAYVRTQSLVADAQRYVRATLEPFCGQHRFFFIDRRKDLTSLSEKLESGRVAAWSKIDDLYACTIVVPVAGRIPMVHRKLRTSFDEHQVRERASVAKAPDVFRFDGFRWYGTITADAASQRQPGVGELLFEVQVVTAFEYAWIAVTHDLVYKADHSDWRRQRLAAQLKAAVEQIEVLIDAFETASASVVESPHAETSAKAAVIERCSLWIQDGLIPETIVPASLRRFADNFISLVRSFERNPVSLHSTVGGLLDLLDRDLRQPDGTQLPVSGSLFQYVLSFVARDHVPGSIDRFTAVKSRELSDIYGLRHIPRPFVFDGAAAGALEDTGSKSHDAN